MTDENENKYQVPIDFFKTFNNLKDKGLKIEFQKTDDDSFSIYPTGILDINNDLRILREWSKSQMNLSLSECNNLENLSNDEKQNIQNCYYNIQSVWSKYASAFILTKFYYISDQIYTLCYNYLLEIEPYPLHKGIILHNWGIILYHYLPNKNFGSKLITLAFIDDLQHTSLTKTTINEVKEKKNAYRFLRSVYGFSNAYLEKIIKFTTKFVKKGKVITHTHPEKILFEYELSNKEFSGFYNIFDTSTKPKIHINRKLLSELYEEVIKDDSATSGTKGTRMEKLGFYLFGCIEGFILTFQKRTKIERSDILIRNHNSHPSLSNFGDYLIVECKNLIDEISPKDISHLINSLTSRRCNTGILLSKMGITGSKQDLSGSMLSASYAFQRFGLVIIQLDSKDIESIISGKDFLEILQKRYEEIRFC